MFSPLAKPACDNHTKQNTGLEHPRRKQLNPVSRWADGKSPFTIKRQGMKREDTTKYKCHGNLKQARRNVSLNGWHSETGSLRSVNIQFECSTLASVIFIIITVIW